MHLRVLNSTDWGHKINSHPNYIKMPFVRTMIFTPEGAFNLVDTMNFIHELYHGFESPAISEEDYNAVINILSELKYTLFVDRETLIPDLNTGVYRFLDRWLEDWGVVASTWWGMDWYDGETVATYSLTDSGTDDYEGEECISDDEEQLICDVAVIIADLMDVDGHDHGQCEEVNGQSD